MNDDTFEQDAAIDDELDEELEADDLDDDLDADLETDDDLDEIGIDTDLAVDDVVEDDDTVAAVVDTEKPVRGDDEEEEDVLDLDEELHPDDVEAPLDALLQERTAAATLEDEDEDEEEEEEPELDDRTDGAPTRIVPRRPGEFLCSSCFLVLPRTQLQDEERMLCRDCA